MSLVFLAEDEVLTRMMVADMVTDLGHTVAAEAGDLSSALEHANSAAFDFAVLDVRLGRDSIAPVAKVLALRSQRVMERTEYQKNLADDMPAKPFR
jgi:CheY-like chemotaxis protein